MWLGPSHRQAKDNEKNSGVDGSLTSCGDAQKESENKAFIQVFHPHTVSKINQRSDVGVAEHRQATQHMQLHEQ